MTVKRFLLAGGMASLVLIGVVLVVVPKSIAQPMSEDEIDSAAQQGVDRFTDANLPGGADSMVDPAAQQGVDRFTDANLPPLPNGTPPAPAPPTGEGGGGPPPAPAPPTGEGGGGPPLASAPPTGEGGGGPPLASAPPTGEGGGAGGSTPPATVLPETGGPSVVLLPTAGPLLLASALLLGSGLWIAAFVRSVRS
jgi:hypothetical protein